MNKVCISIVLFAVAGSIYCSNDCSPACASGSKCCGTTCYDQATQQCCDGTIQNNVGKLPQCCGTQMIDFSTQTCCGTTAYDRINGRVTWCCGDAVFSPSTDECCHNVVVPHGACTSSFIRVAAGGPEGQCNPSCVNGNKCCNTVCYDKDTQLCCGGTVFDKVGAKPQCCAGQPIDNDKTVCCNDVPHDRNGVTWCCGTDSFSPVTDVCCNQAVVPRGSCTPT